MQGSLDYLKTQLWSKIEKIFKKYTSKYNYVISNLAESNNQIHTSNVQIIINDVLGQQSKQQIDYVIKNMFRLDSDNSGTVSFEQFANFLFKRHCGEMSLQKMHKENKLKYGTDRKITLQQLHILLNNAYYFLNVQCPFELSQKIFQQTDTDNDKLITYVEYFTLTDKYICKSNKKVIYKSQLAPVVAQVEKQRNSRFRSFIWIQFRKLYDLFIQGRRVLATDKQLKKLIISITGELSQSQLTFLLAQLFKINMQYIQFQIFTSHFLYFIAELRLSRFSKYHNSHDKIILKDQFYVLLKNTYHFLNFGRIKIQFLQKLYYSVDLNKDGFVSYEQYLDWIKRFVSVYKFYGNQFYFIEDDLNVNNDYSYLLQVQKKVVSVQKIVKKASIIIFTFKDHTLAYNVRQRMYSLLTQYDANKNELFELEQIKNALVGILNENSIQLRYVTANVIRYDRNGDHRVTYDQFTNFCVQQHFGEMAIQRLHLKQYYSRGKQRIMNQLEFCKTLNYSLSFIKIQATNDQLKNLFQQIDLDKDGWITYQLYFYFLKYYFGTFSFAYSNPRIKLENQINTIQYDQKFLLNLQYLSVTQRFIRIFMDQLRQICLKYDQNKNLSFQQEQIQIILLEVFKFSKTQIDYIIYNYVRFNIRSEKSASFEQFIAIILEIYFIQILFKRKYNSSNINLWKNKTFTVSEFIDLIYQSCYFISIKPSKNDLSSIFLILDTNRDGYISFEEYIAFIRQYLGKKLEIAEQSINKPLKTKTQQVGVTQAQITFVSLIWDQLKAYFDKYDIGKKGFLKQDQLKAFVLQVLQETSQRQLDYIFWNLMRVDSNYNKQIDFYEFAPFILKHAGEISLQRFHKQQIKGKNNLNQNQFYSVLSGAYNFLVSMPKNQQNIGKIFQRIKKQNSVGYSKYLQWISESFCKKYKV